MSAPRGSWTAGGRGGPPPWWPEGEAWPPAGEGPRQASRRFRRRFLVISLVFLVLVLAGVFLLGLVLGGAADGSRSVGERRWDGPPRGLVLLVLLAGGAAVFVTYRLLTRPVGALVGAAERLRGGELGVQVPPTGPRELRSLTTTFNDMSAELASAEERRRVVLAEVSHELRTPLAVLRAGLEGQLDGVQPRDDAHLQSLLEEAEQLGRLIDDLHTAALADAGRLELRREPCRPDVLVADAVGGHGAVAARRGIGVEVEVADGLPDLDVDPVRMRQVLDNLLANALRHAPDGGRVVVRADATTLRGGGAVRVVVQDDGPGIDPSQLDLVFERFTRDADSRGSGIGLSVARDLVVAHGGSITARNPPTGGAELVVLLPVVA